MVLHSRLYGSNFAALDCNYDGVSLDSGKSSVASILVSAQCMYYILYVTIIRTKLNNK